MLRIRAKGEGRELWETVSGVGCKHRMRSRSFQVGRLLSSFLGGHPKEVIKD